MFYGWPLANVQRSGSLPNVLHRNMAQGRSFQLQNLCEVITLSRKHFESEKLCLHSPKSFAAVRRKKGEMEVIFDSFEPQIKTRISIITLRRTIAFRRRLH